MRVTVTSKAALFYHSYLLCFCQRQNQEEEMQGRLKEENEHVPQTKGYQPPTQS